MRRVWRLRIATLLLILAFLILLFVGNLHWAHAGNPAILGEWIRGWFDTPVPHRRSRYGSNYTTPLGIDVTWYLLGAAFVAAGAGIGMIYKVPFDRNNIWDDDDWTPFGRRRGCIGWTRWWW